MKTSEKLLTGVVLVLTLMLCLAFGASAATEGYYTYDIKYVDVGKYEAIITDVDTSISGDVIIPSVLGKNYKVCEIGYMAFDGCESITSLTIPDSVTVIGWDAFKNCSSLKSVTLPDGLTVIQSGVFEGCRSIKSIIIPHGVTEIETYAFSECTSLKSVTLPDSVTKIGWEAFKNCSSLESVVIPDGVTEIATYTFAGCKNLASVTIPDSVTEIDYGAFVYCEKLTSVTIPDSVTEIGYYAFHMSGLTHITIPDGVIKINDYAFLDCENLISVTVSESVTHIGEIPFADCESLVSITVDENNANYCSEDGVLFDKNKTVLMKYPVGNERISYSIPYGVTTINGDAFDDCPSLTNITIPDTVTSIGEHTFSKNDNLTDVFYSGSEEQWKKTDIKYGNEDLTDARIHYLSDSFNHYSRTIILPTCTEKGYTKYECKCGYSYVADYVNAKGHSYLIFNIIEPTCENEGYTTYMCECGHSYNGDKTSATGHNYNGDICVDCGESKTDNCTCMCHKSGLMGIIWKILRFFYKLFKTNAVCACGVAHY